MLSLSDIVAALPSVRYDCSSIATSDASEIREFIASVVPEVPEVCVPPRKAACLSADRCIRRPKDGQSFPANLCRGRLKCDFMRFRKALKKEEAKEEAMKSEVKPIVQNHNNSRLRAGDRIGGILVLPGSQDALQAQQYLPAKVLEIAWMQVGGIRTLRGGVDGMKKELAAVSSVSCVLWEMQQTFLKKQLEILRRLRSPIVILKHFDATPRCVSFGTARDAVMPYARYAAWNAEEAKCLPVLNGLMASTSPWKPMMHC